MASPGPHRGGAFNGPGNLIQLGDYQKLAYTSIQDSGVPIAVLLPVAEYERLMAYVKRKAAFHDFARNLGREVEQRGISEEEFMADLEKTKREVFTEQYGRPA